MNIKITNLSDVSNRTAHIDWLVRQSREGFNALGFLPRIRLEQYSRLGWIRVGSDQGQNVGFVVVGEHKNRYRIYQLWTVKDARRIGVGRSLTVDLEERANRLGHDVVHCRVATDLDSTIFWEAMNYHEKEIVPGGRSRKRLISVREKKLNVSTQVEPSLSVCAGILLSVQHKYPNTRMILGTELSTDD